MNFIMNIIFTTQLFMCQLFITQAYCKPRLFKDTCQSVKAVQYCFTEGDFTLYRSSNDTLSKQDALAWKIVSFTVLFHQEMSGSLVMYNQLGNKILPVVLKKMREVGGESICLFIENIYARNIYTGRAMKLPSIFIKIPKERL